MPNSFHGIHTASSALRAFQRAMDTIGHNMANVNTKGYSRQTPELQSLANGTFWSTGQQSLGSGVSLTALTRVRAEFLDMRMSSAQGDLGRGRALAMQMKELEGVFPEPGELGIGHSLDQFFNAWSALASNPHDITTRSNLRQATLTLTQRVRTAESDLRALRTSAEQKVSTAIDHVNNLSEEVARLNQQIRQTTVTGASPNDLLDQRDLVIEEISKHVNVQPIKHDDGSVSLYVSNSPIVSREAAFALPKTYDASTGNLIPTSGPQIPLRKGEILGYLQSIARVDQARADLDTLANELRTQVNNLHQSGTNLQGNTGVLFFNDSIPQTGAIDFELSADVLASADAISAGLTGNSGDGGIALSISMVRSTAMSGLNNKSFTDFYRDVVGVIAQEAGYYQTLEKTQSEIVFQVEEQRQSVSGVSLDDEMADLMRYQRSYQAAAKVLSVLDQSTEDLINLIR